MLFKTHLLFGFLCALFGVQFLQPQNQILFVILAVIGSALPDLDHPNSKLGRKVKIVAYLFEHRGFTHGLFILVPLLFFSLYYMQTVNAYALLIGYISHIAIDMLTVEGIMPLHPISKFRLRGFVRTGHSLEYVVMAVLLVGIIYSIFWMSIFIIWFYFL